MTRSFILSLLLIVCAAAQQHPLPVEPSSLLEPGHAQFDLGAAYFVDQPFPLSGLTGDLLKAGTLRFAVSLSEYVELQTDGTLLNLLDVKERQPAFNSSIASRSRLTGDIGDFTVWTKFGVLSEYKSGIGFSVRFGVQLPNASNESGLGIDEMNFYSLLLFERHIGGLITANAGLGILSDPVVLGQQHDVFLYGVQYTLPVASTTSLMLQTAGRRGHSGPAMHHLSNFKAGVEHGFGDFTLKAYGVSNFSEFDSSKGAELSIAYLFHVITMK